jgi:hypothetical protein
LTNLAAIAFSFALVARVRGVARPWRSVEYKPQFVVLGALAFLVLATPLAITLRRVTQESFLSSTVRREVVRELDIDASQIAQLTVSYPLLETPSISVTAVTPAYRSTAEAQLIARLSQILGREPEFALRQIVAADTRAQTQAMIDAALAQALDPDSNTPNIEDVRAAARAPIIGAWTDPSTDAVILAAAPLDALSLGDYRNEETRLNAAFPNRRIVLTPPFRQSLYTPYPEAGVAPDLTDAIWALKRWGVRSVIVTSDAEHADAFIQLLRTANLQATQSTLGETPAGCPDRCRSGALLEATLATEPEAPQATP